MKLKFAYVTTLHNQREYEFDDDLPLQTCMKLVLEEDNIQLHTCRRVMVVNSNYKTTNVIQDITIRLKDLPIHENEFIALYILHRG